MSRHILLPTDGSALSQNAVQYGISLAFVMKWSKRPFSDGAYDPNWS